eukprot:jgi/Psemu1/15259/gm1.15259_g
MKRKEQLNKYNELYQPSPPMHGGKDQYQEVYQLRSRGTPAGGEEFMDDEEGGKQAIWYFITKFNKDPDAKGTIITAFNQRRFTKLMDTTNHAHFERINFIVDCIDLLLGEQGAALTDNQRKKILSQAGSSVWQCHYLGDLGLHVHCKTMWILTKRRSQSLEKRKKNNDRGGQHVGCGGGQMGQGGKHISSNNTCHKSSS